MNGKEKTTVEVSRKLKPFVDRLKLLERLGEVDRQILNQIAAANTLDEAIAPLK